MAVLIILILAVALIRLSIGYYRRHWARALTVRLDFDRPAYHVGDTGSLIITVVNKKLLPFWPGSIQFALPPCILPEHGDRGQTGFKAPLSAFSFEKLRKAVPFTAVARGYFEITAAELLTQDLFFEFRLLKTYPVTAEIHVYPELRVVPETEDDFRRLTGEVIARRHLIEDPFQFRGIREYAPFDSLKSVNWSATAKTGALMVNQYYSTDTREVCILLDFDRVRVWEPPELREAMIGAAARLMVSLIQGGVPVGLATNAPDAADSTEAGLPCKNGGTHRERFLRQLARINAGRITRPFDEVLNGQIGRVGRNLQLILLSTDTGPRLQSRVEALQSTGCPVEWLWFHDRGGETLPPAFHGLHGIEVG